VVGANRSGKLHPQSSFQARVIVRGSDENRPQPLGAKGGQIGLRQRLA
jgi:hypothetical protein